MARPIALRVSRAEERTAVLATDLKLWAAPSGAEATATLKGALRLPASKAAAASAEARALSAAAVCSGTSRMRAGSGEVPLRTEGSR